MHQKVNQCTKVHKCIRVHMCTKSELFRCTCAPWCTGALFVHFFHLCTFGALFVNSAPKVHKCTKKHMCTKNAPKSESVHQSAQVHQSAHVHQKFTFWCTCAPWCIGALFVHFFTCALFGAIMLFWYSCALMVHYWCTFCVPKLVHFLNWWGRWGCRGWWEWLGCWGRSCFGRSRI